MYKNFAVSINICTFVAPMMIFTDDNTHISLSEANSLVREAVEMTLPEALWVQAEVLDIREKGHCYMELVEKDDAYNTPIAQARACCWNNTWQVVKRKCEEALNSQQGDVSAWRGLRMLFLLRANFHEAYGFSWIVEDIDPTYTIGEMARRRAEILKKLKEAGIIDMQKELPISPFATRIAVISTTNWQKTTMALPSRPRSSRPLCRANRRAIASSQPSMP